MKLNEIVNTDTDRSMDYPNQETHQKIGNGYYANVYQHKDDPHMVTKHAVKDDPGYELYMQLLNQNDRMGSNPYFPRIYRTNGRVTDIEKLSPITSINSAELAHIISTAFGSVDNLVNSSTKWFREKLAQVTNKADKQKLLTTMLSSALDDMASEKVPVEVQSKELAQAIQMLQSIDTDALYSDISSDNLMIRRGPNGVQLVLTDPIAPNEYYGGGSY